MNSYSEGVCGCWKSKKVGNIFEGDIVLMIKPIIIREVLSATNANSGEP